MLEAGGIICILVVVVGGFLVYTKHKNDEKKEDK